jgi:hypothetical protein
MLISAISQWQERLLPQQITELGLQQEKMQEKFQP